MLINYETDALHAAKDSLDRVYTRDQRATRAIYNTFLSLFYVSISLWLELVIFEEKVKKKNNIRNVKIKFRYLFKKIKNSEIFKKYIFIWYRTLYLSEVSDLLIFFV